MVFPVLPGIITKPIYKALCQPHQSIAVCRVTSGNARFQGVGCRTIVRSQRRSTSMNPKLSENRRSFVSMRGPSTITVTVPDPVPFVEQSTGAHVTV